MCYKLWVQCYWIAQMHLHWILCKWTASAWGSDLLFIIMCRKHIHCIELWSIKRTDDLRILNAKPLEKCVKTPLKNFITCGLLFLVLLFCIAIICYKLLMSPQFDQDQTYHFLISLLSCSWSRYFSCVFCVDFQDASDWLKKKHIGNRHFVCKIPKTTFIAQEKSR